MHPSLERLDHRPWTLPREPWKWRQSWVDLAFLHYRVDARALAPFVSKKVKIQEFDGSAWIGVVPFRMAGVMRRPFPNVPGISSFRELNVRTYVEANGRSGVWFLSLDTDSIPFALGGKHVYGLPYYLAKMSQIYREGWTEYSSIRSSQPNASFVAKYRPVGEVFQSEPGSFEHWATERYCLFSGSRTLQSVDIHHLPWPLQNGEAIVTENTMFKPLGLEPLSEEFLCHYSTGVDAISFSNRNLG